MEWTPANLQPLTIPGVTKFQLITSVTRQEDLDPLKLTSCEMTSVRKRRDIVAYIHVSEL